MDTHDRTHRHGLAADLGALVARRRFLGYGAAGLGLLLAGCDVSGPPDGGPEANRTATAADGTLCIKDPAETNGPFPADGSNRIWGSTVNVLDKAGIIREDIRGSFGALTAVADGVPLSLDLRLVDVSGACDPLANHLVYVWHCDAAGLYSIYNLSDSNYLRGAGVTDASGRVRFTTIFPGAYPGRWPHIHFEVFAATDRAANVRDSLLVSQFALPADVCKGLYAASPVYAGSDKAFGGTTLKSDGVFGDNTPEQIATQTLSMSGDRSQGFSATATIGIVASGGASAA